VCETSVAFVAFETVSAASVQTIGICTDAVNIKLIDINCVILLNLEEIDMSNRFPLKAAYAAALLATLGSNVLAADGWKVRFPLSGTLGGEIAAPIGAGGLYGQVSVTQIEVDKLAGPDGNDFQITRSGTIPVDLTKNPLTAALGVRSASFSGQVTGGLKQSQTQVNSVIGYLSKEKYNNGQLSFAVNIPYISMTRTVTYSGKPPTLGAISPSLTASGVSATTAAGIQAQAQAGFNAAYPGLLATSSATNSGSPTGLGDIEVTGAWVYQDPEMKVIAATTLALPTGVFDQATGLNLGYGKFYTLRPSVTVAYNTSDNLTLGARTSLALNTRNTDNNVKSGNFYGLDLAASYRTSIGVFGPHVVFVNQYEDDDGGNYGSNRFSTSGAGLFFATKIPAIDAGLNISYMQAFDARNALSGNFIQFRLTKQF
jgi:hypothetical protein